MITDWFSLPELVCPEVYHKYGDTAWSFFDTRLLITLEVIRQKINKPIIINDWQIHGDFSQRGFRCVQCQLQKDVFQSGELFVDPHATGQAVDFDVAGCVASEIRDYIIKNKTLWPYPIRLEDGVSWVHLDTRNKTDDKVILFT